MKLLLEILIVIYLVMGTYYFTTWLEFFEQEPITSYSSVDSYLSRVALVISTIFWPVVVPIAYIVLLKAEESKVLDVTMSNGSSSLRYLLVSIYLSNLIAISGLATFTYLEFMYHF